MNSPLGQALDLTHTMLDVVKAGDWARFRRLHERRTRLLKPGVYTQTDTPRLLPQLDAAQRELASMLRDDTAALDGISDLLRPISHTPDATQPGAHCRRKPMDAAP